MISNGSGLGEPLGALETVGDLECDPQPLGRGAPPAKVLNDMDPSHPDGPTEFAEELMLSLHLLHVTRF